MTCAGPVRLKRRLESNVMSFGHEQDYQDLVW